MKRLILWGAFMAMLVAFGSDYYLQSIYVSYPRKPDPVTAKTVAHQINGVSVYVTRSEMNVLNVVYIAEIVSGIIVVISLLVDRISSSRNSD